MIEVASPNHVFVVFSAPIIPTTAASLISIMADCVNQRVNRVTLLLTTPGGNVASGIQLYSVLRGMPFKLTTHNTGDVGSIANLLFLAGETRVTVGQARFNFHGVGFDVPQGQRFEEKTIRERLNGILEDQDRIGSVFVERTGLTPDEVRALFSEASTKDAQWAVAKGFATGIGDVSIPTGSRVISLGPKA